MEYLIAADLEGIHGVLGKPPACAHPFRSPAQLEVRFTRAERTPHAYKRAEKLGVAVNYGEDTHTLRYEITTPHQILKVL